MAGNYPYQTASQTKRKDALSVKEMQRHSAKQCRPMVAWGAAPTLAIFRGLAQATFLSRESRDSIRRLPAAAMPARLQ